MLFLGTLTEPDHCFDLLRQMILCNADPSLVYWWNDNYTYIDEAGNKRYTDEYLSMPVHERFLKSSVKWDVPTQCRDISAIDSWIDAHQIDIDMYREYDREWDKVHHTQ